MLEPTPVTWLLSIVGVAIYLPAVYIQVLAVCKPHDQKTKDMLVGKGGDYHDKTYFAFCQGTGWADLCVQIPLVLVGCVAVLFAELWGYVLWFAGASITIYIHLVLVFVEGRHVYAHWGPLAFLTYGWGLWVWWGIVVVIYSLTRMAKVLV
jgi:hypothetical protein